MWTKAPYLAPIRAGLNTKNFCAPPLLLKVRERERERDSALEMYFLFSLPIPIMELRLDRLNEGNEPNTRTAVLFAFRTVV